jgi:biotin carboxyl carrier protein
MPKEQGVMRRLLVKVCPQFVEDWLGAAGVRFRKGARAIAAYNVEHVQIGEKLDAAPGMLWRAAEGATSVQHAKAEADYAKAENDRIEAELRRRTLEASTRHACADANKAEADAGLAKIREMQGRIELYKQLKEIGVAVSIDAGSFEITAIPVPPTFGAPPSPTSVITQEEKDDIRSALLQVIFQPKQADATEFTLQSWSCGEGDRIAAGFTLCEVSALLPSSPLTIADWKIESYGSGTVLEILVQAGTLLKPGDVLATILPDA